MKRKFFISSFIAFFAFCTAAFPQQTQDRMVNFYGDTIRFSLQKSGIPEFGLPISSESIERFKETVNKDCYEELISALLEYKRLHHPDDWLYYQLIRRTAESISPKAENYYRYTIYKWYLLTKSGYDATVSVCGDQLLFYVQSDENIYNIPSHTKNGKQYVCLNYHDYGSIDFEKHHFMEVSVNVPEAKHSFSYMISQLPVFPATDYLEKKIDFAYNENEYHFKLKLNPQVKTIFANYPVVDYKYYFNTPLSKETYQSLIPTLRRNIKGLTVKNGVDYLMQFTRYAFPYESDQDNFGREKRLSPEQTLLYDKSDCEDRAALFYYLVKEIYNLPMIVVNFPNHVTVAVKFQRAIGKSIVYNGSQYSICEPTPQKQALAIGQWLPELMTSPYEIAYMYDPATKK